MVEIFKKILLLRSHWFTTLYKFQVYIVLSLPLHLNKIINTHIYPEVPYILISLQCSDVIHIVVFSLPDEKYPLFLSPTNRDLLLISFSIYLLLIPYSLFITTYYLLLTSYLFSIPLLTNTNHQPPTNLLTNYLLIYFLIYLFTYYFASCPIYFYTPWYNLFLHSNLYIHYPYSKGKKTPTICFFNLIKRIGSWMKPLEQIDQ